MKRKDILTEKEQIEMATAAAFIKHYNTLMKTSFKIIEHSDAPDFLCLDSQNNELKLEITLTEDLPNDIKAMLGRSNHRSIETLKKQNEFIKAGKAHPLEFVSCISGNVTKMIVNNIKKKLAKDYGNNAALVVRDSSPLDWDWSMVIDSVKESFDLSRNPYDKGIWIVSYDKNMIFQIM